MTTQHNDAQLASAPAADRRGGGQDSGEALQAPVGT
jgi:hypothetical protein